jgi:hypothetical protein
MQTLDMGLVYLIENQLVIILMGFSKRLNGHFRVINGF